MRVGMILDKAFPPDTRVNNEADILIAIGIEVHILCFSSIENPQEEENLNGIHIHRLKKGSRYISWGRGLINTYFDYYSIYLKSEIDIFIKKYNLDILHVHDLYLMKAVSLVSKNIPVVLDMHENYVDGLDYYKFSNTWIGKLLISKNRWRKFERDYSRKADWIITVVEEMKNRIASVTNKEEIIVYSNYVNLEVFYKCPLNNDLINKYKKYYVLSYIGGFDYHRGIFTLIDAVPTIIQTILNLKVLLIGKGKIINEIKSRIQALNIQNYIDIIPWISPQELPNYFRISNIGVIPHIKSVQTDNSSPNKLFQYMTAGKPVVVSDCISLERIVKGSRCGAVFQSNNHLDLSNSITDIYENFDKYKLMGKNGISAVKNKYNTQISGRELVHLYETINADIKQ